MLLLLDVGEIKNGVLATLPPQCPREGWHGGREMRWGEVRWKERRGWDCTNKNAPFLKGRRWVWWSELGSVFQRLVIWSISRHRGLFRSMTLFVCARVPLRMYCTSVKSCYESILVIYSVETSSLKILKKKQS